MAQDVEQLIALLRGLGPIGDVTGRQAISGYDDNGAQYSTAYSSQTLADLLGSGISLSPQRRSELQGDQQVYIDDPSLGYHFGLDLDGDKRLVGQIGADGTISDMRQRSTGGGLHGFVDKIGQSLLDIGPLLPLAAAAIANPAMLGLGAGSAGTGAAPISASSPTWVGGAPISASSPSWLAGVGSTSGLTPAGIAALEAGAGAGSAGATSAAGGTLSALRNLAPLAAVAGAGGGTSALSTPVADPQAGLNDAISQINDLFATEKRSPVYQQVYDDVYGAQSARLAENREDTLRKMRFGLARTGLAGGSADVSVHGREQREFGRALTDASNAAQGQADQVRANDESTRLNLIAQMRAGMDSADATQSALAQMQNNASAAGTQARYDALDSYMGAIAPTIQNLNVRAGQRDARNIYSGYPQIRSSLSGRTGQIVG